MDGVLQWISRATGAQRIERGERIQSLWRGYGEIYRVHLDGRETAIVKSVEPPQRPAADPSHERKCRSYDVELAWYRHYASRSPARVPKFIAGTRAGDRWLFVLEDLDAAGYPGRHRRAASDRALDRCLAWLAAFHAHFLGVAPDGLWPRGTYWHLATRRHELAAIEDPGLRAAAAPIDRRLRACKHPTLVHGDAKLANFCFGERDVAAVDFQYVGAGCGVSDVAYLLSHCTEADERRLLEQYFVHLRDALAASTADARPEHGMAAPVDAVALENEWRALYPIAAADFYRFYAGWAREQWPHERAGQRWVREALRML